MKWEKVRLEDCCYSISDGDHQPPPKAQQGIPFVTISNINSMNQLDFSDTMFVPKEYYQSLDEKRKVRKGDDTLFCGRFIWNSCSDRRKKDHLFFSDILRFYVQKKILLTVDSCFIQC